MTQTRIIAQNGPRAGDNTMKKALQSVLTKLANCRSLEAAVKLIQAAEEQGCVWRAVGDRPGNYGNISIGSDPGLALVERVTNAIDSVIEREFLRYSRKKKRVPLLTPREAVQELFGIRDGRLSGMPVDKKKGSKQVSRQELADNIRVTLLDGETRKHPTVVVRDAGVGLTPGQVPNTILSLNENNKIDKPYLAGAFGQGGSTALAFSPLGTLIVTRRQPDLLEGGEDDLVSITFVRYEELSATTNKNGRYAYLVLADNSVPAVAAKTLPEFDAGTCVVHFSMEIPQYSQKMTQLTNSLWWLMQNALFDPVLPIWIEDARTHGPSSSAERGEKIERRSIAGNFTRLHDDKKSKVEHADSVECALPNQMGSLRVNFWVLKSDPDVPRESPVDAYVDPHQPVVYTYNGQTHGTDDRRFVTERLDLAYLARFLIVHVELDQLSPLARRKILSSTRDRLKKSDLLREIREAIRSALSADEQLARLNKERKEALLSRHSETERQKMRERFAKLMDRFRAGVDVPAVQPAPAEKTKNSGAAGKGGESGPAPDPNSGGRGPLPALPTREEPTFIRVSNTQQPVPIRLDRHALIRIESDAPDEYLRRPHAKLVITSDPEGVIEVSHQSDFYGGRCRSAVSATSAARAGKTAVLTVLLVTVSKAVLTAKVKVRFEQPKEQPTSARDGKAKVDVPDPVPIQRAEWGRFGWDESSVAHVMRDSKETTIYVNIDNRHIAKLLHSGNYQEVGITRMKNNYLLYVAFYSWMQNIAASKENADLDAEALDAYLRHEYDRVAQTVVFAISAESRVEES